MLYRSQLRLGILFAASFLIDETSSRVTSSRVRNSHDASRKAQANFRKQKEPKKCAKSVGDYKNLFIDVDDYYQDDWFDECREWWLLVSPTTSPSITQKPVFPPSSKPSNVPTQVPSEIPSNLPSPTPSNKPTQDPSRIPSEYPTKLPTPSPSQKPSLTASHEPSDQPSISPTKLPTSTPSTFPTQNPSFSPTKSPSQAPSVSHTPTYLVKVRVPLPKFELGLRFESLILRRLDRTKDNQHRHLRGLAGSELVNEGKLFTLIFLLLNESFEEKIPGFHSIDLELKYLGESSSKTSTKTISKALYSFTGEIVLLTNSVIDASKIPSESKLVVETLTSFSGYKGSIPESIDEATHDSFTSWTVTNVDNSGFEVNDKNDNVEEVKKLAGNGTLSVTVASSVVAILSTLTAFGLIYKQKRTRSNETINNETPRKKESLDDNILKSIKFRSPFMTSTPPDGTRKYFSKLDDESVNSSKFGKMINPNQSLVNSSFDESSYAASLEAPSLTGLSSVNQQSKVGGQSVDLESLADMSALDKVRLGNVLQIEDGGPDEQSMTSNDTRVDRAKNAFSKIWYGGRHKIVKESSVGKLTPPTKDTPTKRSPETSKVKIASAEKSCDSDEEEVDDASLLGDQSNKGEYYGQNDEDSNLFYNMLGDRSVQSEESESVDINFNEMYNADGVASSSGYSENNSVASYDYDAISRTSKMSSVGGVLMGVNE